MNVSELQSRARRNEPMSKHTTSRLGGPADMLIEARSTEELIGLAARAEEMGLPWVVIGGGANVLVSDAGIRGLVILNRAKEMKWMVRDTSARVEVDSGAGLITLARECIERGLAGFEWAISVPGTVGGAAVGNAGAHGSDMAACLNMAKILRRDGTLEYWTPRQMQFAYRTSALKQYAPKDRPMVVSASIDLRRDNRANLEKRAAEFTAKRKASQPPGATIGSMFKNPTGDYAGRLIEACGLKGRQAGGAMISPVHANFFVNASAEAKAADFKALIDLAHDEVFKRFGVDLELEVELVGEWNSEAGMQNAEKEIEN